MLLVVVEIAVAVLAVAVLGALVHGLVGAAQRLRRELAALEQNLEPVRGELQAAAARAAALPGTRR